MRATTAANRLLCLVTLVLGVVLGVVASPARGANVVGQAAAQSLACPGAAIDPPTRVWRDGRFAGP
jgi:hypothetical protein